MIHDRLYVWPLVDYLLGHEGEEQGGTYLTPSHMMTHVWHYIEVLALSAGSETGFFRIIWELFRHYFCDQFPLRYFMPWFFHLTICRLPAYKETWKQNTTTRGPGIADVEICWPNYQSSSSINAYQCQVSPLFSPGPFFFYGIIFVGTGHNWDLALRCGFLRDPHTRALRGAECGFVQKHPGTSDLEMVRCWRKSWGTSSMKIPMVWAVVKKQGLKKRCLGT